MPHHVIKFVFVLLQMADDELQAIRAQRMAQMRQQQQQMGDPNQVSTGLIKLLFCTIFLYAFVIDVGRPEAGGRA